MRRPPGCVRTRVAGLTALTATAVLLATAPAAAETTKLLTSGFADASSVHLRLGAPLGDQLDDQLGGKLSGQQLDLDLVNAHGVHEYGDLCATGATRATAEATIASGTGITEKIGGLTPFAALNRGVYADLEHPGPAADAYGQIPASTPLLSGALGPVHAKVTSKVGNSSSSGKLAVLRVGSIGQKLSPSSLHELTGTMHALQEQLDTMLPKVNDILGGVMSNLPGTPAAKQAADIRSGLLQLDERMQDILNGLSGQALLELKGLTASQQVTRTKNGLRAHAEAKLGSLNLLAGLLQIEGFHNSATAFAGGEPGTAKASAEPEAVDLEIAGVLEASYGPEGLRLPGLERLPGDVQGQLHKPVTMLLDQVMETLSQGGLNLGLAQERTDTAEDGTSAIAESGGLLVAFDPPGSDEAAFEFGVGQVVASVAAKRVERSKADCGQPSPPPERHKNDPPTLAYTGPRIPHSGLLGFGFLAAATAIGAPLFLRRRRFPGSTRRSADTSTSNDTGTA